jgi:hypothetical protein
MNRGRGWAAIFGPLPGLYVCDAARAELWPRLVGESPAVAEHQAKTTRQIPVFMLTRQD